MVYESEEYSSEELDLDECPDSDIVLDVSVLPAEAGLSVLAIGYKINGDAHLNYVPFNTDDLKISPSEFAETQEKRAETKRSLECAVEGLIRQVIDSKKRLWGIRFNRNSRGLDLTRGNQMRIRRCIENAYEYLSEEYFCDVSLS